MLYMLIAILLHRKKSSTSHAAIDMHVHDAPSVFVTTLLLHMHTVA